MRFVTNERALARSPWFVPLLLSATLLAAARPATGGQVGAGEDPSLAEAPAMATTRKDPGRGRVDPRPAAAPGLPGTAAATTSLTMDSEPGDWIGGGQHHIYTPADGSFSVTGGSRNRVSIRFSGGSHNWNLDFSAPNNAPLALGTYTGATRYPFNSTSEPGLSVSGDGRGCNTLTGSFQIKQITFNAQNIVTSFWAKFEQHCEGGTPALTGDIRYNATVVVEVAAPSSRRVVFGQNLGFVVSAVSADSSHVTLRATGLPAGASFQDHGDNTGSFSWTPAFDQIGMNVATTFHGDDGRGGADSATTQIRVDGLTGLSMTSDAGDYIGGGQQYRYTPEDGSFTVSGNRNHVTISFSSSSHFWYLDFSAPNNANLAPGTYAGARRYPFNGSNEPGLSVRGDGRGCNTLTGSFQIKQITFDAQNRLATFWAKFEQHCEGVSAALTGDIRYNAKITVEVNSPATASVAFNRPLQFDVSASSWDSSLVTLTAAGLPPGATFQDNGDNTGRFAWTPTFGQIGLQASVVFRGDNGRGGRDSSVTQVAATGLTSLAMSSDPGDYIGQGQSYSFTPEDGSFRLSGNRSQVNVTFTSSTQSWTLEFAAPGGGSLAVGTYPNATRYAGSSTPGLGVGGNYRGCSTISGSFQIKQITFDAQNMVASLWAKFEQHCEGVGPALTGDIRYNAKITVEVNSPATASVAFNRPLQFDVSASSYDSSLVTLTAAGLPPGATFQDNGDNTGRFAWTPTFGQIGLQASVVFRGDNGRGGRDSSVTRVAATGLTSLAMSSDPGDYIGQGQSYSFTPEDGSFRLSGNRSQVNVTFTSSSQTWTLDFAAPSGGSLGVGNYPNAARYAGSSTPGLGVGGNYRGCSTISGSFRIRQITFDANNKPLVFRATFEQHCDAGQAAIAGEVRYNAPVPVEISAPFRRTLSEGQALSFPVSARSHDGSHVTLTATVPAGSRFIDNGDGTGAFDWTPGVHQQGTYTAVFRGVNGHGVADSVVMSIVVTGVTSLHIVSVPRDSLDYGQETFLTAADATFGAQRNYRNGITITGQDSSSRYWQVDFAAPFDALLTRGIYQGTGPLQNQASLQFTGNCYGGTGSFVVKQVEYGPGNSINSFWATFELTCSYGPNFHGEVRYNADVPLILTAPRAATVSEDAALSFDVRALSVPGAGISIASASLPRGATFVDHADNTGTFAWRPGFAEEGRHRVSFVAYDGAGTIDSVWTLVTVLDVNRSPVARAGGPYQATAGVPLVLNGSGSTDPDGNTLYYLWTFGDGGAGSGAEATHAYASAGVYPVTLTVTDGLLTARDSTQVTVAGGPAVPEILSFLPTLGPVGTRVTVRGRNFMGVTAVTFNGRGAAFTVPSPEQIEAIVPSGATSGPVAIRTAVGIATTSDSFTVTPPGVAACPHDPEFWARHVSRWPVEWLLLGAVRYERAELLAFLGGRHGDGKHDDEGKHDDDEEKESSPSMDLARQLVAAKLNLISLSGGPEGSAAIASADSVIGSRRIPFESKEGCGEGKRLRRLIRTLEDYNEGEFSPGCDDSKPLASDTGARIEGAAALSLSLAQNAPNPFGRSTAIDFSLARAQEMRLSVYDLLGREVRVLMSGWQEAGRHTATWNGTDASGRNADSGVYFYRLSTGGTQLVRRMVLMRR